MSLRAAEAPPQNGKRPKLADRLVDTLRGQIASGRLAPGSQLSTELQLAAEYGVSRTVVREAITRLAADGLVEARQGAGIFVRTPRAIDLDALIVETAQRVSMVLNVLEVRMAIEIESAALAADRRSPSQDADINAAFREFNALLVSGEPTGAADFAFHRAIAIATNNPFYVEILDVLGRRTIPRDVVTTLAGDLLRSEHYQMQLQAEHRAIMSAISSANADAAREAMRAHLSASQRRYQGLLQDGEDIAGLFPRSAA